MYEVEKSAHQTKVETIENVADTKGVELEAIKVFEDSTAEGDDMLIFRPLTHEGETEKESVGTQFSVVPSGPTSDMDFRTKVQDALSTLKRGDSGDQEDSLPDPDEVRDEQNQTTKQTETVTEDVDLNDTLSDDGDLTPEEALMYRRRNLERRVNDLEERIEELENYVDALEGLQQFMGASANNTENEDND